MARSAQIFVMILLSIVIISPIYYTSAHSLFNSSEEKIGSHRVQIATLPEIPTVNEKSQILFRVLDDNELEVDKFRMGARIYYNDVLVDTFPAQYHDDGHWETDYTFTQPGIHIFRVDLYDIAENGGVITYTFNISTLNPFGYIFYYIIIAGGFGGSGLVIWSILSRKKIKTKP
ncbi:MAG: hypothetical protein ACT4N5_05240 [Nitrosopumilaceae archaeon]